MPNVPASLPSHEEKLDLPDVPTKPPTAADAGEIAPAEASTKRKGLSLSLLYTHLFIRTH